MDRRFFYRLGASQIDRGALCAGTQDLAFTSLYGDVPGMPPEEVEHSDLVIVWGLNVTVSALHMQRVLQRARRNGARLVVVDPKCIKVAQQADLHLALKPGTDVVLGYAVAAELERIGGIDREFAARWILGLEPYLARARETTIEQAARICGIAVEDIRTLAMWYRDSKAASMMVGVAVERNRNGGSGVRAASALPALAGKFGVRGGGLIFGVGCAFPVNSDQLQRPDLMATPSRMLNILDIPRHILSRDVDPPIAALFFYNHNPLAVHPLQHQMREALNSPDVFTVGCDVVMTDSLAYADIILPACSHFEHDDVYAAYGQYYVQRGRPVIEPVGEALPNTEIFRRLAKRFGYDDPALTADDDQLMDDAFDLQDERLQGHRPATMASDHALAMQRNGRPDVLFENCYPATPSGRVELYSDVLNRDYQQGLPGYREQESEFPLILVSPSSDKRTNAMFGGCQDSQGHELLEMNSSDAALRNLSNNMLVHAFNDLGCVELRLKITDDIRPGVVLSPKGTWLATSPTGQTINALIPGHKTDIGDGACYNDCRIEVRAA